MKTLYGCSDRFVASICTEEGEEYESDIYTEEFLEALDDFQCSTTSQECKEALIKFYTESLEYLTKQITN
jgi:hypothetical protein